MDRKRKDHREDYRIPEGLRFMVWPALVRAPWLIGDVMGRGGGERREADRRRKHDR